MQKALDDLLSAFRQVQRGLCVVTKFHLKTFQGEFETIGVRVHQQDPKPSGFSLKSQQKVVAKWLVCLLLC